MRNSQAMPSARDSEVSGHKERRASGAREALQHQRAAQIHHALVQALHVLRPLRLAAVGRVASGPPVRGVQDERAQAVPEERGQQLRHQSEADRAHPQRARHLR